jgi:hypothetical protein
MLRHCRSTNHTPGERPRIHGMRAEGQPKRRERSALGQMDRTTSIGLDGVGHATSTDLAGTVRLVTEESAQMQL